MSILARPSRVRKPDYPVTPSTLESAWNLGYRLGKLGADAPASSVYNHRERAAFAIGHGIGLREYHLAEIAEAEAWCRQRELDGPDVWGDGSEW
jgi:hypothetical protein